MSKGSIEITVAGDECLGIMTLRTGDGRVSRRRFASYAEARAFAQQFQGYAIATVGPQNIAAYEETENE